MPLALIAVLLAASTAAMSADARYMLSADAIPTTIAADGKSYSQIAITVTDPIAGRPAPDGTEVRVTTTAGTVTTAAYTTGGRATAILTSTSSSGVAVVTASISGVSASTQVEFASDAGDDSLGTKIVRISGGSLAYSVERDVVLGSDQVSIEYRGVTITAASVQVNESLGTIKAQGGVEVVHSNGAICGDALVCDLRDDRCRMLSTDGGNRVASFKLSDIKPATYVPVNGPAPADFMPLEASATKTWIVARKLSIFPNERIQFTHASIYMGDTHVLNLPHYLYNYNDRGSLFKQVRYTSYEGLVVDMPVYYSVTDAESGALKLRYSGKGDSYGGYYRPREGMSLALDQAYSIGERSDGRLFVDAISSPERSFELMHHQEFGGIGNIGRLDLSASLQPLSQYARNVYTGSLNLTGSLGRYDYNLSGFIGGSKIPVWDPSATAEQSYWSQNDGSIKTTFRTRRSYPLGGLSWSPNLTVGYGRLGIGVGVSNDPALYQSLGMNFYSKSYGGRKISLTFDGSSDLTTANDGRTGAGIRTSANLRRSWTGGSASLSYTLALTAGSVSNTFAISKHTLGGMFFLGSGAKWNCYSYFGYGLDTGRMNLSTSATMQVTNTWKLRSNYSLYRYSYDISGKNYASSMSYLKLGMYRPLGPYEIGLAWSPNGEEFGPTGGRQIWLEVGLSGF